MTRSKAFRNVMGCFATGVTIVTTKYHHEFYGLTVNSFTSVSLEPMLILINVEKRAFTHDKILHAKCFAVNILTNQQKDLSRRFAQSSDVSKFSGLDIYEGKTGAPIIQGSFAYLDARVARIYEGGDHTMIVGEVIDMGILNEHALPLVYYHSQYHDIGGATR